MSGFALQAVGGFGRGRKTETLGTVIRVLVPGDKHAYTYLTHLRYKVAGTAHTLTMMKGQSSADVTTAVPAAGTSVIVDAALLDGAGNALAANDVLAIEVTNIASGVKGWHLSLVTTWTVGTLTIVIATAIPAGFRVDVGGRVVSFGIPGDAGHADNTILTGTSETVSHPAVSNSGPLLRSATKNEPIIISSNNATAAGVIEETSAVYATR